MHDLIAALAGKVALRRDGPVLRGRCPIHEEKTASFTVFPADRHYHCFGCGAHGWIDELIGGKRPDKATRLHEKPKTWPKLDWGTFTREMEPDELQQALATARGYSAGFVKWLVSAGHIGAYDGQFAFPIRHNGEIVRAHVRCAHGNRWFYVPNEGCPIDAFMIRRDDIRYTPKHVHLGYVHIFESQWDTLAAMDQLGVNGIWIATRGACNAAKLGALRLPKHAPYYVWTQNDEAGERWLRDVMLYIPHEQWSARQVIRMPDGVKDANDFTRAGGSLKDLLK